MKIVFVSDAIYPYHKGGKEKRIFEITSRLANLGHEVHIYCMNWWQGPEIIQKNKVWLHGICKNKPIYVKGRRSISQAIYFAIKVFFPLLRINFDVIEADNIPHFPVYTCKLVCMLKRKKLFLTWHEVWGKEYWLQYLGKKGYIAYLIEKYSTFLPHKFIAVSAFTKKRLINFFHVPADKIAIVENGIELTKQDSAILKNTDVIFAGRLLKNKNVNVLLQSLALVAKNKSDLSAVIIGVGPEKENLIKLAKQLNLPNNVSFDDFLSEAEFQKKVLQSKIFVSCSEREGFGMAVLEALAYGLPVVIINHPDNAAVDIVVDQEDGFITSLQPSIIAQKILMILNNHVLYETMQEKARKKIYQYQWNDKVKELINIYRLEKNGTSD